MVGKWMKKWGWELGFWFGMDIGKRFPGGFGLLR